MTRAKGLFEAATSLRVANSAYEAVAAALKSHVEQLADDLVDQLAKNGRSTVEEQDLMGIFASCVSPCHD